MAGVIFAAAALATLYGIVNARWVRVRKIKIPLRNLPDSWRGRVAALVSDVHLGHVNGAGFLRRIVDSTTDLKPDIAFITGDLYDGTAINAPPRPAPGKTSPLPRRLLRHRQPRRIQRSLPDISKQFATPDYAFSRIKSF